MIKCSTRRPALSITTFRIMTLSMMTLSIKCSYVTLSISETECKWHSLWQCSAVMLNVITLSVICWVWWCQYVLYQLIMKWKILMSFKFSNLPKFFHEQNKKSKLIEIETDNRKYQHRSCLIYTQALNRPETHIQFINSYLFKLRLLAIATISTVFMPV